MRVFHPSIKKVWPGGESRTRQTRQTSRLTRLSSPALARGLSRACQLVVINSGEKSRGRRRDAAWRVSPRALRRSKPPSTAAFQLPGFARLDRPDSLRRAHKAAVSTCFFRGNLKWAASQEAVTLPWLSAHSIRTGIGGDSYMLNPQPRLSRINFRPSISFPVGRNIAQKCAPDH